VYPWAERDEQRGEPGNVFAPQSAAALTR